MKLLSALFDTALLPLAIIADVVDITNHIDGNKSYTRKQIEKIEDNL